MINRGGGLWMKTQIDVNIVFCGEWVFFLFFLFILQELKWISCWPVGADPIIQTRFSRLAQADWCSSWYIPWQVSWHRTWKEEDCLGSILRTQSAERREKHKILHEIISTCVWHKSGNGVSLSHQSVTKDSQADVWVQLRLCQQSGSLCFSAQLQHHECGLKIRATSCS